MKTKCHGKCQIGIVYKMSCGIKPLTLYTIAVQDIDVVVVAVVVAVVDLTRFMCKLEIRQFSIKLSFPYVRIQCAML